MSRVQLAPSDYSTVAALQSRSGSLVGALRAGQVLACGLPICIAISPDRFLRTRGRESNPKRASARVVRFLKTTSARISTVGIVTADGAIACVAEFVEGGHTVHSVRSKRRKRSTRTGVRYTVYR